VEVYFANFKTFQYLSLILVIELFIVKKK